MLDEQVADSVKWGKEAISWAPEPPFDTITNYIGLVKGTPLTTANLNIEYISGVLAYTVVFLMFLAFIRLRGRGVLSSVYAYFFTRRKDTALLPEGLRQNYFFIFLSTILSFSILAMLLTFCTTTPFSFSAALTYFLVMLGYYFLTLGMVRLFGWTFNGWNCASDIMLNMRVSAIVFGLSASPFVIALFYVKPSATCLLYYSLAALFLILLIFRFIRMIKILYGYRVSILYMILYLCGLEILPILVLYKLLV